MSKESHQTVQNGKKVSMSDGMEDLNRSNPSAMIANWKETNNNNNNILLLLLLLL